MKRASVKGSDLTPFFGDLSLSEKLSAIKAPVDMIYSLRQLRGRSPRHRKKEDFFSTET